ncbi:TPA: hypothetical protein U5D50_004285 [Yersinia enterocolitica]|nr:hypothetical protein [Yersinia enterocolitica]
MSNVKNEEYLRNLAEAGLTEDEVKRTVETVDVYNEDCDLYFSLPDDEDE